MSAAEIVAILTGVGGLIAGLIAAISGAKKEEVNALNAMVASLKATIDGLTAENGRLRVRLNEMDDCLTESESNIRELTRQLADWKDKYERLLAEFTAFKARTTKGLGQ